MAVISETGMLIPIIKLANCGFSLWLMAIIDAVFIEPKAAPMMHILPIHSFAGNRIFCCSNIRYNIKIINGAINSLKNKPNNSGFCARFSFDILICKPIDNRARTVNGLPSFCKISFIELGK